MNKGWTDLNLSSLKYFVDAINHNSLTLAAEQNHVSRPAVSQAIRRLEDQLGFELITHKKRLLSLTEDGKKFYAKAAQALEIFKSTLNKSEVPQNELRIACSATIAEHVVLPLLQTIKFDQSKLRLQIGTSAKVRQLVADGEASLGLLIDDEKTYGFETSLLKKGDFVLQSKTGQLTYPIITTEYRPEVGVALKNLVSKKSDLRFSHLEIESWSLCRKMAELTGGTCLVPDLIPLNNLKRIRSNFKYEYQLIALTKNKSLLSDLENRFFKLNLGKGI